MSAMFSRSLKFVMLVGVTLLLGAAAASAADCPADKVGADVMKPGPSAPTGVTDTVIASIDLAAATGASFIREIMSGVYASDFGLWNTNVGETARHKAKLTPKLRLLFNIVPEAAAYLGDRSIADIARSTAFNNRPDAICVSGLTAGAETDTQVLSMVKKAVPGSAVLCNTGCRIDNIERQFAVSDGAVVGSTFKIDGAFENPVDPARVKAFMDKVKTIRSASHAVA